MNKYAYITTRSSWGDDNLLEKITEYITDCTPTTTLPKQTMSKPTIKQVIFNDPATIIKWTDGTKTVVKCQGEDDYDMEKGFVMAYLKKLLGNNNTFNKEINHWVYGGK